MTMTMSIVNDNDRLRNDLFGNVNDNGDAACTDKWDDGYCSKRMCYDGYGEVGGDCCKTCSEKYKTGVAGCEYGNREGDQYCGQFDPAKCPDDAQLRERCCWLCRSDAGKWRMFIGCP